MSDVVDLPLVILQKAQHAAEAAAKSAQLLETEAGLRLNSIEARLVAVEGRLTSLYAGQSANTVALMRISDMQSEHTARLNGIDARLDAIDTRLDGIEKMINTRLDGIETMVARILAKLP